MNLEPEGPERGVARAAPSPALVVVVVAGEAADADAFAASLPPDVATVVVRPPDHAGASADPARVSLAPGSLLSVDAATSARFTDGAVTTTGASETGAAPRSGGSAVARTLLSLAETYEDRAAAVILRRATADEERALAAVHRAGGIALRRQDGGFAFADDGRAVPGRTLALADGSAAVADAARRWRDRLADLDPAALDTVLARLERVGGASVRFLKPAMVARRVGRRVALTGASGPADYLARLGRDDGEARALHGDLFIGVTRFFRDAALWRVLEAEVIPRLVAERAGGTIRLWVAGASTGEEAYSYAMLLADEMDRQGVRAEVTIFATDVNAAAIDAARSGVFDPLRTADVPADRLGRHFVADGDRLRVASRIRDMIVFAAQDLLVDPPFPDVDLVSCRNVLIYFDAAAQPRVLDSLAYALVPGGTLVLGAAEAPGQRSGRFDPVSVEGRIWRKRPAAEAGGAAAAALAGISVAEPVSPEAARRALLDAFAPPSVVVDVHRSVRYVHGPARDHLAIPEGEPTSDILDLVDRRLRVPLRDALERAAAGRMTVIPPIADGAGLVTVRRLSGFADALLVSFGEGTATPREPSGDDLSEALAAARAELQATVEELESANEELKAASEEVMSVNAELQRTNVELEASRDDLTRANARLSATNSALEETVAELQRSNSDLATLLQSIDVATLFLDRGLAVRRYTPRAREVFGIEPGDVGSPIHTLSLTLDDPLLAADAERVLEHLAPIEREVRAGERWLMRRIVPRRTTNHIIDGVLVTAWDVTPLKATAERLARRERQQAAVAAFGEVATRAAANVRALLDEAVATVAEHLDAPLIKVLELAPDWETLLLRAGVGWREGIVGVARLPAEAGSQAGFTLRHGAPVLVDDLAAERRFTGPALLLDHGVVSGLSVAVGPTDSPWGVIGAHTTARRHFTVDDVNFLQAIANIVYATIERQRVARAYRIAAERLELAVSAGGLATWEWDIVTGETVWSDGHYSMLGYRKAEVRSTVEAWRARVHPDDRDKAEAAINAALDGDGRFAVEYRVVPQTGVERWLEGRGRTVLDAAGKPVRMFGVIIDITERKRAEERQTVLLNELDHRVRNTLANIVALARQTRGRATSVDGYVTDFTDRLSAIGRAHTLLSEARWAGASLATLLEEAFAALRRTPQVALDGPTVVFGPDDAQLFSLAFHELAVNAVRHGALRTPAGRLFVSWRPETVSGAEVLAIDWRELGETPVELPRSEGFGSLVLTRLLPVQTDSLLSLEYAPEGLRCRILVPRGRVEVSPSRPTVAAPGAVQPTVSLAGRSILVVEDSMLTALDIEAMLREEGADTVVLAGTVEEAEALLARGRVDLALLDRNLAGTMADGVARALVAAGIPFVFMTGYNSQAIPPDLRGIPVLNKPFEAETMLAILAEVL